MRLVLVLMVSIVSMVAGQSAFALPLSAKGVIRHSFGPMPLTFTTDFDFEGIIELSNCSGSLIRLENSVDTDQAYVLTNGHCLQEGFPEPGEHVYRQPSRRRFNVLNSAGGVAGLLNANQIVYSTMTGTDMTIYRVNETYAEILRRFNVRPLTLASQHPVVAQEIEIISGYWGRGFRCAIETFVYELREGGYSMSDSIRYTRPGCEVYGGTSGSPIVDKLTRSVIGINNTGNEDGRRCTMNNPCEVDETGHIDAVQGYSYGQQTFRVYSCLNAAREIDLSVPGCLLH